ncbi:MAG: FAD binding domain-containing protein [Elusimicrobia bacterium]|nr:FAD binding domain-containing protein [Elusimicrobiota bacterium]
MLRLPAFRYAAPTSLREALERLRRPAAAPLAGGTDLVCKLKRRQRLPEALVDLRRVEALRGIKPVARGLSLGASATVSELAASELLAPWTALVEAARLVASPAIRNRATLGGNLCQDTRCCFNDQTEGWRRGLDACLKAGGEVCHAAPASERCRAVFSGDIATALIALRARVRLASLTGERVEALEDLYQDDGAAGLRKDPGELVVEVVLEGPPPESRYLKLRRRDAFDFPALGAGVAVRRAPDSGRVAEARIVLGGVASCPMLAAEAGLSLLGRALDEAAIRRAAALAAQAARPLGNNDFAPGYRKRMAGVFVARALRSLADPGSTEERS